MKDCSLDGDCRQDRTCLDCVQWQPEPVMTRAKQVCLAFNLKFQRLEPERQRKEDEAKDAAIMYALTILKAQTTAINEYREQEREHGSG